MSRASSLRTRVARQITAAIRKSVTIDSAVKQTVRAALGTFACRKVQGFENRSGKAE